ncbi:probable polyol transporter 4 [Lactuca sativa]|uniref:Major facilitator superfamily (MFS) profile domain-containing protein n=1 Tax=Lactuca sativa TaxID=4236 RepID=A0A9R1VR74_LACSA|nr:probable polyol transporter 4 [Lactuca sativa]KAJ0211055.1 hypothetical protein LSAT_V11C400178130 [Lactuca sativa]
MKMALQEMDLEQKKQTRFNTKHFVFACAVFASLNSVLLGYDVGVMGGAIIFMQQDLKISEVQVEVIVGILNIVSLIGSLAGGKASDTIGRKRTMAFGAFIFQFGVIVMTIAPNFGILLIGRLVAGIGIGFAVLIVPIYIVEISPTTSRGLLTSFPEIFINFGILLGYVSSYVFRGLPVNINWRIMLGIGIIPSVFIGFALLVIPESPRWLAMNNRIDEARLVLLKTNDNEMEIDERLNEIRKVALNANDARLVWKELVNPTPGVKRMLIAGCGIQCFQQITGIDAIVYYSPMIFKSAGITGNSRLLGTTMAVGFTKAFVIVVAIVLIDRIGRKPLLYVSTIGMTLCTLSLGIAFSVLKNSSIGMESVVVFVCGNVGFFSIGIEPVCWVLSSEIFPLRLRSQASAIGVVGNRVISGIVAMSFLSIARRITMGGVFFLFAIISGFSVLFVHKCVPETKGKSLEQIETIFQSARRELEIEEQRLVMSKSKY